MAQPQVMQPGSTCDTCGRRVPHERKPTTPKTKPKAYRVPVDEVDAHDDVLETAAKHLGAHNRPYWQFWTITYALAAVLQDEGLRGAASRSPVA